MSVPDLPNIDHVKQLALRIADAYGLDPMTVQDVTVELPAQSFGSVTVRLVLTQPALDAILWR